MGRMILCAGLLLFAGYTAATALTQVQPGERGVVRRFGRILETKAEPGLYIGWPWGVDRVERVPVGLARRLAVGMTDSEAAEEDVMPVGQMLTGDHNLVNVQAEIYFKVREADVEKFVLQQDRIDGFATRAAESTLAEWIGARKVDDVLRDGKMDLPPFLRSRLHDRLLPYDLGIQIDHVTITRLAPPKEVKEAFELVAQEQNNIKTTINRAQQDADKRLSDAAAKKFSLERLAQAYANEERLKADAEAAGFLRRLEQYRVLASKSPDYLNAMWLNDMTRIYKSMKDAGRLGLLDHYLSSEGLSITQFPLQPKK
jgi:membrane protease subunit HflK